MADRYATGKKVAYIGIAINLGLLIMKLIAGGISHSQAMIADGFNSVGDVFASMITLFGSVYASKPKDADHVWGHGKAEYIASMIIGFSMVAMAIFTIVNSIEALLAGMTLTFSWGLILVAIATIICKFIAFLYTMRQSKEYNSLLMKANAQDHRNDIFITSGTLIAIICSLFGIGWLDGLVGIVISAWIIYSGFTIIRDSSGVLMDKNAGTDLLDNCVQAIAEIEGIDHVDSVNAKPVGAKFLLVVKVSVNREMNVLRSHEIAGEIKQMLLNNHTDVEDVLVHINPDIPHET